MAPRKSLRKADKRSVRRRRTSVSGKILRPLDVRSKSSLSEFKKRILKGPLTIILVYADWCGQCHHMMPHWDQAVQSPGRSIQAVKVNETMLDDVNSTVNHSINRSAKPLQVDGFPSIILVDKKGNRVTDIQPVKDTKVLTNVMNQSGEIAQETGLVSENNESKSMNTVMSESGLKANRIKLPSNVEEESVGEMIENSVENVGEVNRNVNRNIEGKKKNIPMEAISTPKKGLMVGEELGMNTPLSYKPRLEKTEGERSFLYSQTPPDVLEDMDRRSIKDVMKMRPNELKRGGGLYNAMAQASYTLAPAAILLATAATVMKRKSRKSKKSHLRRKKTHKRH
jgi:thiol-disulfide isomerase/thioredoxin